MQMKTATMALARPGPGRRAVAAARGGAAGRAQGWMRRAISTNTAATNGSASSSSSSSSKDTSDATGQGTATSQDAASHEHPYASASMTHRGSRRSRSRGGCATGHAWSPSSFFHDPVSAYMARDPFFSPFFQNYAYPQQQSQQSQQPPPQQQPPPRSAYDSLFAHHPLLCHWLAPFQTVFGAPPAQSGSGSPSSSSSNVSDAGTVGAPAAPPSVASSALAQQQQQAQLQQRPYAHPFANFFGNALGEWDDGSRGVWHWDTELLNPVRMDLDEAEHAYVMNVKVPGMSKNDLHVKLERNEQLHIWGRHTEERDDEESSGSASTSASSECGGGGGSGGGGGGGSGIKSKRTVSFDRWIAVPDTVQLDAINATYENGALVITLPKTEQAKKSGKHAEIAIE